MTHGFNKYDDKERRRFRREVKKNKERKFNTKQPFFKRNRTEDDDRDYYEY